MLSRPSLFALFFPAVAALSGCGAGAADPASSSDEINVEQAGIDVQVLQVWTPGRAIPSRASWLGPRAGDVTFDASDPSVCPTLETKNWDRWEDRTVDCTAALAKASPFDTTGEAGPLMAPRTFHVSKSTSGEGPYVDPDYCQRLEMRVVVRDAASSQPKFLGIGFYTSSGEGFTPKSELQAVGHVTLKNGDPATVYRFTGTSTCISSAHNSTSGNMYQTFSFKPYAAYGTADDDPASPRYRVWEKIAGNHVLGHSWPGSRPAVDADGFDRQAELLQH